MPFEKHHQLLHRHAPSFIRYVLECFRLRTLTATQAAEQLGLSRSRLYALSTAYLRARAKQQAHLWTPGASGGDHAQPWPAPVLALLHQRLACQPPCPYSFAASEALRRHAFKLDRAQVRRWAIENKLAHSVPPQRVRAPVRRWQCAQIGQALATGRLAPPLVPGLSHRLAHAQQARRLQPPLHRRQALRARTPARLL